MSSPAPETAAATPRLDECGLELLEHAECLRLLGGASIGRVAFTADALPAVRPVNFVLCGNRIVFRTRPGSRLDAAMRNAIVAFEADDYDQVTHTGWCVTTVGQVSMVDDPVQAAELAGLAWLPWTVGARKHYASIVIGAVAGHRIATPREQPPPR